MNTGTTTYIVLKELAGNRPPHLDMLQQILAAHLETVSAFWISLWIMTFIVVLYQVYKEYRASRHGK